MQHPGGGFFQVFQAFVGQRERWPLWLPVFLGMGIGIYFALPFEPPLWIGWGAALVLAAISLVLRSRLLSTLVVNAVLVVVLGVALAGLRTWWVAAPMILSETGPVSVTGQVERLEILDQGQRVTLTNLNIQRLSPSAMPRSVRLKLNGDQPRFQPGDWLELRANLRPPPPPAMPGAFDFQRQSYFRGLGGVGFVYGKAEVVGHAPTDGIDSLGFAFERLRAHIGERVRSTLGGTQGALAQALMTGERGAIPKPVIEDMRASGLAHLLAISGLHVGLIAGIVFFAVRAGLALITPLALKYPIKKWAAVAAIVAAFGYAMLAGATVPTQRAFLMISLVLLAVVFERTAISLRLVAWAAMVILVIAPESLLGASFQMSFAAVVALVAAYEALKHRGFLVGRGETWVGRLGRYIVGVALTTAIAGASTGIFAAYHFNRVADFGLVANLIAVPVTALWIMPWAVVGYLLMPLGLGGLALVPMGWGIEVVVATANEVGGWPGAVTAVSAFPTWGLALVALGGLWLALWRGGMRAWGLMVMAMGVLSGWAERAPDVLVHQDGKLAAVRAVDGGYSFSTLRSAKFERDVWMRRAGLNTASRWTDRQAGIKQAVRCDALGCIYQGDNKTVAFAHSPEAIREDCHRSDVLVIREPIDSVGCQHAAVLITFDNLKTQGAHAIWLGGAGQAPRIETVADGRGVRPWVIRE